MTSIVDWASSHARMVIAFVVLSIVAGMASYIGLPKEGEPDIEIPALFVSVPFPGISAEDSEKLLIKPLETKLRDLDGLKRLSASAAEGYGLVIMEFEFGWDKQATIAEVRDRVNKAEADWPAGAEQYSIDEINFSEFPILVLSLAGQLPERTLLRVAKDLQTEIESLGAVLEAPLSGHRDEMLEVLIDPLQLESYNVTASELIRVVVNNNQLVAAGEVESGSGAYAVKIPSSFDEPADIYNLPVKVNGDRVITLGELADIRLTFEDRAGTARFNGEPTVALQIVKRKGANLIDTVEEVKATVAAAVADWPAELQSAVRVNYSMDQSKQVDGMVRQLEASVLTAIALVMIVVLASLGIRSALLVGFAIPTSFLLCFAILAVLGITISNIVMFALILAVGMLVDGAIVVVEYADKEIQRGRGPMQAYVAASKRMFWPIVSSTATTLCAFLPMLFWPGVPGEFMGNLPKTIIFVLSASLVVALVYLPVLGGVAGRISRFLAERSQALNAAWPFTVRLALLVVAAVGVVAGFFLIVGGAATLPGAILFVAASMTLSVAAGSLRRKRLPPVGKAGYRRSVFGRVIHLIAGNPVMPIVALGATFFAVSSVFSYFGAHSRGVEFFVETEPEQAIVYVRARGNLSLAEKDRLVFWVEQEILTFPEVASAFAFAGSGGINSNTGGAESPRDTIGQVQIEFTRWENRALVDGKPFAGKDVLARMEATLKALPGIQIDILEMARGPASGKPVNVRLISDNWQDLLAATDTVHRKLAANADLRAVEDTRPLPGIDWQIDVDVEKAGRYGADVATVGAMVQLVTRGILLDKMQVESSDEEIEIRVRYPEKDRVLSTLDTMRVRTPDGLIPLSNFISRKPVPKLGQINRYQTERYFLVKADVNDGVNAQAKIEQVGAWLGLQDILPADMVANELPSWLDGVVAADGPAFAKLSAWLAQAALSPPEGEDLRPWLRGQIAAADGPVLTALATEIGPGVALPDTLTWEFAGDQVEQQESQDFLGKAFAGALGLMFVILLAQFNSFYNAIVVLLAVVLSVTGVLVGMLVMDQTFSIIMTGTGVVALAGIVVNNNIVLIDTYQEYARYLPRVEAITRTAEARIRPVLLTTITTMAGLTPMMFGVSVDFFGGGYTVNAPTALWWKQLATAVVFGLGLATVLTLIVTPAMLATRVWAVKGLSLLAAFYLRVRSGADSAPWLDRRLRRQARKMAAEDIDWTRDVIPPARPRRLLPTTPQAAE